MSRTKAQATRCSVYIYVVLFYRLLDVVTPKLNWAHLSLLSYLLIWRWNDCVRDGYVSTLKGKGKGKGPQETIILYHSALSFFSFDLSRLRYIYHMNYHFSLNTRHYFNDLFFTVSYRFKCNLVFFFFFNMWKILICLFHLFLFLFGQL